MADFTDIDIDHQLTMEHGQAADGEAMGDRTAEGCGAQRRYQRKPA